MILNVLDEIFQLLLQKGVAFCFYMLPESSEIRIVAQKNVESTEFSDSDFKNNVSGFLFRTFDTTTPLQLIKADFEGNINDFDINEFIDLPNIDPANDDPKSDIPSINKDQYLTNVSEIVGQIKGGSVDKVVYARTRTIPNKKSPVRLFHFLSVQHDHAFRYLLKTADGQVWLGASPEILLKKDENFFRTVALAGTVGNQLEQSLFEDKNADEQNIVSLYIEKIIGENGGKNIECSDPFASRASNVSHIKTNITFEYKDSSLEGVTRMSEALHPTPAVGGEPLGEALKIIRALEPMPRGLYAGYIGPYGLDGHMEMYVNIRCARIYKDEVTLFVGGGITKDSDAHEEWEETELKAKLMEEVVQNA